MWTKIKAVETGVNESYELPRLSKKSCFWTQIPGIAKWLSDLLHWNAVNSGVMPLPAQTSHLQGKWNTAYEFVGQTFQNKNCDTLSLQHVKLFRHPWLFLTLSQEIQFIDRNKYESQMPNHYLLQKVSNNCRTCWFMRILWQKAKPFNDTHSNPLKHRTRGSYFNLVYSLLIFSLSGLEEWFCVLYHFFNGFFLLKERK